MKCLILRLPTLSLPQRIWLHDINFERLHTEILNKSQASKIIFSEDIPFHLTEHLIMYNSTEDQ